MMPRKGKCQRDDIIALSKPCGSPTGDLPTNWSCSRGGQSLGKFLQSLIKKNEIVIIKCIRM